MQGAAAPVPNLFRAVAECTQPYGPRASGSAVRSLEAYLADERCVDAVYRAILARACAEPQSEAVTAKCVGLIRAYVGKHTPSAGVLAAIAAACQRLGACLPPESALHRSLLYLGSSVGRLAAAAADSTAAGRRGLATTSQRSATSNASSRSTWAQQHATTTHNGPAAAGAGAGGGAGGGSSGSNKAAAAVAAAVAGGSVHSSVSELGGLAEQQPLHLQQQQPGQSEQQLLAQHEGAVRLVPQTAHLPPSWTFQPSALQELWAGDGGDDAGAASLDWSLRLPQFSPSLVPLIEGLPGMDLLNLLSCSDIVDTIITDADAATQLRQLREISEVRRLQGGVSPDVLRQAMQAALGHRARRLFQPLPYSQQEAADVAASDVAAVVEVMCGKPSPAAPSAITGAVGLEDPAPYWQPPAAQASSAGGGGGGPASGAQQQQQPLLLLYQQTSSLGGAPGQPQRHVESVGQISSCLVVKLVVDLWLSAGGAAASPLVLRMLQQALHQLQPQYRARAFDVLYNLSLHGCMLMPAIASPPPSPQHQQQQQPLASPHSPYSQGQHSSSVSPPPPQLSPRAGLQQQHPPSSMAAAAAAAGGGGGAVPLSSGSPVPSPKGRSRLARSDLSWNAVGAAASQGPEQQEEQEGAAAAAAAPPPLQGQQQLSVEMEWEAWLQQLLYELLLMLAMVEEPCEAVWQSALGCLLHLTTHGGHWVAASLGQLPPAAAAALLDACVRFNWSQELHAHLVQMAGNLLYHHHHAQKAAGMQQQQQQPHGDRRGSISNGQPPPQQQQQRQERDPASQQQQPAASPAVVGRSPEPPPSQCGDLDLPCLLHAGPVDEGQLAAFGGPPALLRHFCHAASVEAQRTLLVPLLQVLMPRDAPDTAQLALLQVLCARPDCLSALQTAAAAGVPGWAATVAAAVMQQVGSEEVDRHLLALVLARFEALAVQQAAATGVVAAGLPQQPEEAPAAADPEEGTAPEAQQQHQQQLLPPEVALAVRVTLQQLRGELPCQVQSRPVAGASPPGASHREQQEEHEELVFQVQPEVQGAWRALRNLCWCDDALARRACRQWLQQLLAATLRLSLEGAILLPLPGVRQRPATGHADPAAAASAAAVTAACEALSDVLSQLVAHCPRGAELLVDALQLHITASKLQVQGAPLAPPHHHAKGAAGSDGSDGSQQQRRRAAVARECVQAWAFVCQWVLQARVATSQAALTRLAAMAHSLACVLEVPDCFGALSSDAHVPASGQQQQQHQQQRLAMAAVHDSSDSLALPHEESSQQGAPGRYKGVPPLQPSSEPLSLAGGGSRAAAGAAAGALGQAVHGSRQPPGGMPAAAAAGGQQALAAVAAEEAVCWPQAFLLGRAVLVQQMAQVLSGASLALLLVRLLQCKPLSRAADRGFHGRPSCSTAVAAAWGQRGGSRGDGAVLPCPLLFPWTDDRQDLQLGLLLMLVSSCCGDGGSGSGSGSCGSFSEYGLEAVTQQVLAGCTDPRACLLASQFVLAHLMATQQERYWAALRALVAAAQAADDERLLGNPFLQLITLLSSGGGVSSDAAGFGPAAERAAPPPLSGGSGRPGWSSSRLP